MPTIEIAAVHSTHDPQETIVWDAERRLDNDFTYQVHTQTSAQDQ